MEGIDPKEHDHLRDRKNAFPSHTSLQELEHFRRMFTSEDADNGVTLVRLIILLSLII